MKRRKLLNENLFKLMLLHGFLLLVFLIIRSVFFSSFGSAIQFQELKENFISILLNALRFDTVVNLYGFALMLLLSLLLLALPKRLLDQYHNFTQKIFKYYTLFITLVFIIISTLDFYYYKMYDNHFDALVFALKNDDTAAILNVFWTDYPLIRIILFWIFVGIIANVIITKIVKIKLKNFTISPLVNYIGVFLFIGIYFVGLRGSLGMFPLKLKHAYVTDNQFLNKMTINSVFALKSVLSKGDTKNKINTDYKKSLQKFGFKSTADAVAVYTNNNKSKNIDSLLFNITPKNSFLEENPPHVVFVLMESFDRHFFDLHSENCNTLGSLEKQLDDCIIFPNILSSGNITINTLENLMVAAPFSAIAQSPYKKVSLSTAVNIPFQQANYNTSFLYTGEYGWRNIGHYAKTQGFDAVITQKHLENDFPNAETNPWGVHDVYLYNKMYDILAKSNKPQFLFSVTISNHTPYVLPSDYKSKPIHLSDSILDKMKTNKELSYKSLKAYQYAADQLGIFIRKVKNSKFGANTIIAVTGDHNSHQGFRYNTNEKFYSHATPFILYIPEKYKKNLKINISKFGSHKDLFPTLFHLSLSAKKYFNTGNNLFDNQPSYSINNFNFAANTHGAVKIGNPSTYYNWKEKSNYLLEETEKTPSLDSLYRNLNAYNAIMHYQIQKEFKEKQ